LIRYFTHCSAIFRKLLQMLKFFSKVIYSTTFSQIIIATNKEKKRKERKASMEETIPMS
jgi:hypothetical protein